MPRYRTDEYYHPRIEELKSEFDIQEYMNQIAYWEYLRTAMWVHNQNAAVTFQKNIPGEIEEKKQEEERRGTSEYDFSADLSEAMDVLWFIWAHFVVSGATMDTSRVRQHVNGFGNRSDIYDKMIDISKNIDLHHPDSGLHTLASLGISLLANLPEKFDTNEAIRAVLSKNTRNYPAEFFGGYDLQTARPLTREELEQKYAHSRKSLKSIRNFHRYVMGEETDKGMPTDDWEKYRSLLRDFRNSEQAFTELQGRIYQDHNLIPPVKL